MGTRVRPCILAFWVLFVGDLLHHGRPELAHDQFATREGGLVEIGVVVLGDVVLDGDRRRLRRGPLRGGGGCGGLRGRGRGRRVGRGPGGGGRGGLGGLGAVARRAS